MAFDVSALSNYTEQNEKLLITRSMFGGKTAMVITADGNIMTGVKSSETVNLLATDAVFQSGGTCGFNSSGTTSFSQRVLTVGKIKVQESLCPATLETKYTQKALTKGSNYTSIAFAEEYTTLKSDTISEQMETATWKGDTTSSDPNLNKFDGFIKLIDGSGAAIAANTAGFMGGATVAAIATNERKIVGGIVKALPAKIMGKKDVRIWCGWDFFSAFVDALVNANLYHIPVDGGVMNEDGGEIVIPGTTYKLTAAHGLDGTNRLFALRTSNMFLGTDIEGEENKWSLRYSEDNEDVRFSSKWKYGTQVALPNEIVQFTLA